MLLELNNQSTAATSWQPSATVQALQARAKILRIIREFFAARNVLEVETPLLARYGVTDPHINTMLLPLGDLQYYLQTSPEYAMKRLLAFGSGCIYQITRAFRGGDLGVLHNPEFSILEWYRVGFDQTQLMVEVDALLHTVLATPAAIRVSYQQLFIQYLAVDPHQTNVAELKNIVNTQQIGVSANFAATATLDDWLDLLFVYKIEPNLTGDLPWFVYGYPKSQAALAKIMVINEVEVAARFEVYYQGLELANAYHELIDPEQQLLRFKADQIMRQQLNKPNMAIDTRLLAALAAGVPECAGIALGLDRLIMLAINAHSIKDVIAFPFETA